MYSTTQHSEASTGLNINNNNNTNNNNKQSLVLFFLFSNIIDWCRLERPVQKHAKQQRIFKM
jgi:hypothetical protein